LPGSAHLTGFAFALSPNYASDQTLFVGTLQQGLMKSVDGGSTLTPVLSVPGYFASGVVVSSGYATDQTVFVSTYLGIYKSTDGGASWAYTAEPARQEEQREIGEGAFTSIVYQGGWSVTGDTAASTSQYLKSSQSGDSASLTFWGSGAAWIGVTSPSGGSAQVVLDGVVDATVSLQSPATNEQQTLWMKRALPCGRHTLTIRASLGGGQSINLDSLDVWQDTCASVVPNRSPTL
jgi:hypothetical protein